MGQHETVGIDLVAMCVNDLVVQGAEPLFFLDYLATGNLDPSAGEEIIAGIATACIEAGCALVGGETAEMPGMYTSDEYDLAGFSVGAVERGQQITGERIKSDDIVLGLASNGLHSNGFSLVRRIVASLSLSYLDPAPFDLDRRLGDALLDPTNLYVKSCLSAKNMDLVHGLAHITGGGLAENLGRVLPDGHAAELDATSWDIPSIFNWLVAAGNVPHEDALRTFNMGIGMVVVVPGNRVGEAIDCFENEGQRVFRIGQIVPRARGSKPVKFNGKIRL
jgi:phosphoribosylformylglycinamidine cyclo-ligase